MHTSDPMLLTIARLKRQRDKIDKLIDQVQHIRLLLRSTALAETKAETSQPKRKWSAAQRAKFVATMRKTWKAKRNGKSKRTYPSTRNRFTAESRRKLSRAAKARWTAAKAKGLKSSKLPTAAELDKAKS